MFKRTLLLFFLLIFLIILNAFLNSFPKKNVPEGFKPSYGVSFSFEQAGWYGLDAQKAYVELLDSAKFDWVRLPFFWDPSTSSGQANQDGENNDVGNIDDLRFGIEEARKRNVKVVIALGAKTPYFPEYHLPEHVGSKAKFGDTFSLDHPIAADLLAVDKKVIKELAQYDNIAYWQVENEPFLANVNGWRIEPSLIQAEIDVVRGFDPRKRPIILNHVGPAVFDKKYKTLLAMLESGDVFGVNAYFKTQGTYLFSFKLGRQINVPWPKWLVWPVQSWIGFSTDFERVKKEVENKGLKFWVLEMQAEPYVRSKDDINKSFDYFKAIDISRADAFLRASRVESVGLWGSSYWVYKKKAGDSSWIDEVRSLAD